MYSNKKTYHSCSVLPESVKQELGLLEEEHEKEKTKLTVNHKGNKGLKTFDYICCSIYQKDKIPVVLEKYKDKLPEHAKVNDLIDQSDILGVADNLFDLAGCFMPDDKNVRMQLQMGDNLSWDPLNTQLFIQSHHPQQAISLTFLQTNLFEIKMGQSEQNNQ